MNFEFSDARFLDVIRMIEDYRLDIRTVTMGISLIGCTRPTMEATAQAVYDRVVERARDLVPVCEGIERELGIPIVNKRISVTPVALVAAGADGNPVEIARALDRAAGELGVNFVGGYSALVEKGGTTADKRLIYSIPEALSETDNVCSSVNVASSRAGINMNAVAKMGEIVKEAAEATADRSSIACAKLVVFANAVGDNPFMAGAFHGIEEPDTVISVGVSGPGVVDNAIAPLKGASLNEVAEEIKKAAFKITRAGQLVGNMAAERLGVPFGIVDLSLAPTAEMGDSVAHVLERMGLDQVGTHGTTAALALLNDAVKKGGMMACSRVGGLSGSFIPVSEDKGMIDAVHSGAISMDKLDLFCRLRHDRHPRRHFSGAHRRHDRRRGCYRCDEPQDHRFAIDSGARDPARRRSELRRVARLRTGDSGEHGGQRRVHPPRRVYPRAGARVQELAAETITDHP